MKKQYFLLGCFFFFFGTSVHAQFFFYIDGQHTIQDNGADGVTIHVYDAKDIKIMNLQDMEDLQNKKEDLLPVVFRQWTGALGWFPSFVLWYWLWHQTLKFL